jgi:hypothetical protein
MDTVQHKCYAYNTLSQYESLVKTVWNAVSSLCLSKCLQYDKLKNAFESYNDL